MASISNAPWDGSPSRFDTPEAYCASCLIDLNDGAKTKSMCMLPVKEPGGAINKNALGPAWGALRGARNASIPDREKGPAARKLIGYYQQAGMDVPPEMRTMAGS